ncbi:MAG: hypothetical protein NVS1B7_4710 [Candidatus Saccharimonadales bacterium]
MNNRQKVIILITVVVFVLSTLFISVLFRKAARENRTLIYSKNDMLEELWSDYKRTNLEPGTHRTLDKQQKNITTSEGQSYTMLRAVWQDDKATFDQSWQWAKDNLQRPDHLLSWKFGQLPNGNYGVQKEVGGQNTATDGDTDIGLSLLMAYSRWKQDSYLFDAKPIISSIWDKEVVTIKNKPVLVANDLEPINQNNVIVNLSYFSPYTYKIFAKVDRAHNWDGLADNSYQILNIASAAKLDTSFSSNLPPDWGQINRKTGQFDAVNANDPNLTTNYGFDAMRIPWRLAVDWNWFHDERDKVALKNIQYLDARWVKTKTIFATYAHDGRPVNSYETPATYGGALSYFAVMNPSAGAEIYKLKLLPLYSPDGQKWKNSLSYYDDNWAWFGMALYLNKLPNLTATT